MTNSAPCSCGCPNTFSTKEADTDLKRYLARGPDGTTQALIDAIVAEGVEGASVLDIGGGIGAIQFGLLAAGAGRTESVDATEAYVAAATAELARRGYGDRASARFGDFVELAPQIADADIVTLDRVVCCDPDLPALLGRAVAHARRVVGLVHPRDAWWNRLAARALDGWARLTRDSTRWHIHPVANIEAILRDAGFERREVKRTLIWQVVLFVRR